MVRHTAETWRVAGTSCQGSNSLVGPGAAPVSISGFIPILQSARAVLERQASHARHDSRHPVHMHVTVTSNVSCIVASCAHSRSNVVRVSLGKRQARAFKLRARVTGSCAVVRRRLAVRSRSSACLGSGGVLGTSWWSRIRVCEADGCRRLGRECRRCGLCV